MKLTRATRAVLILVGISLLVLSVVFVAVGLYPRTPQSLSDQLIAARFWLSTAGSLLIATVIIARPGTPRIRLLLIPVLALGLWIITALAMAVAAYIVFSFYF